MRVKLVRDKIKEVRTTKIRPANSREGKQLALCLKLHEEAAEIAADPTDPEEYGDLLEVMMELARINGVSWNDVLMAQEEKRTWKGGFRQGRVQVFTK